MECSFVLLAEQCVPCHKFRRSLDVPRSTDVVSVSNVLLSVVTTLLVVLVRWWWWGWGCRGRKLESKEGGEESLFVRKTKISEISLSLCHIGPQCLSKVCFAEKMA